MRINFHMKSGTVYFADIDIKDYNADSFVDFVLQVVERANYNNNFFFAGDIAVKISEIECITEGELFVDYSNEKQTI